MENKFEAKETSYEKGMQRLRQAKYIVKVQYRTDNYRTAADLFGQADDYQDAAWQAEECRRLAEKSQMDGVEELYQNSVEAENRIIDVSDANRLVDIFRQLGDYKDSKEHQETCGLIAEKFHVRARMKRNFLLGLGAAFIILCIYGFYTGLWTYVKGRLYGAGGYYAKAVEAFELMGDYLDSEKQLKINQEKLLRSREAQERKTLGNLEAGDEAVFGALTWTVLKASEGELLLIPKKIDKESLLYHIPFDKNGGVNWEDSSLRDYLNTEVLTEYFTEEERGRILGGIEIPDEDMLNNYTEMLSALKTDIWVDLPGEQKGTESYLTGGGSLIRYGCPTDSSEISVCPVIRVHLDDLT